MSEIDRFLLLMAATLLAVLVLTAQHKGEDMPGTEDMRVTTPSTTKPVVFNG